jgi:uncharacterized membrane protein YhfC
MQDFTLIAALLQLLVMFAFPLVLWATFPALLAVPRRMLWVGARGWLAALPFIVGVPLIASALFGRTVIVWSVALSIAAGVAEESMRWLSYRRAAREHDEAAAIVAGAGHGGVESLVLGVQAAIGVAMMFFFRDMLPPEMRAVETPASAFLIGAVSRMLIVAGHIGLTLFVWRGVAQSRKRNWLFAVLAHIGVNLIVFLQPAVLPGWDWLGWLAILILFAWAVPQIAWVWRRGQRGQLAV